VPTQKEAIEEGSFLLRFGELELRGRHSFMNPKINFNQKEFWRASKILPMCPRGKHNDKPVVKS
jgi:hypothetical protein